MGGCLPRNLASFKIKYLYRVFSRVRKVVEIRLSEIKSGCIFAGSAYHFETGLDIFTKLHCYLYFEKKPKKLGGLSDIGITIM